MWSDYSCNLLMGAAKLALIPELGDVWFGFMAYQLL